MTINFSLYQPLSLPPLL